MSRKKAREAVLMTFYQTDIAGADPNQALVASLEYLEQDQQTVFTPEERTYAQDLVKVVIDKLAQADDLVSRYLKEWKLERVAAMDRAVLRVGTAEMLGGQLPPAVVINQAIDLAKKYGDEKSAPFVNAVLDNIREEISHVSSEEQSTSLD
ncbi:MAG: transcription antitermination factor NusB [Methanomassiliicoccales archaeon]